MLKTKGSTKRFPVFNKYDKPSIESILEKNEFEIILNVERARADRSESTFSLVTFEVESLTDRKQLNKLIKAFQNRIRAVDIIGWFDNHVVGIILHSTNMEGAWKFAIDVGVNILPEHSPLPFKVFSYPEHWYDEEDLKFDNFYSGIKQESEEEHKILPISSEKEEFASSVVNDRKKVKKLLVKRIPFWKRAIDVIFSFTGLLLLSPILLLAAVFIKIVSRGPVFFKQERVGFQGKAFTLFKFRTMHQDNNQGFHQKHFQNFFNGDKPMEKLDDKKDPRIIPGGVFFRKSCLDELPQLFNVLLGDMSLVGPRPCIPYEAAEYKRWHHRRFDIVPGMTGLWQVSGKNNLTFKEMVRLDITYSQKMSLGFDLYIMLKTVPTIIGLLLKKGRNGSKANKKASVMELEKAATGN